MDKNTLLQLNNTLINPAGPEGKIRAERHREMNLALAEYAEGVATDLAQSAYLGIATTTTTPPATGAYWYRVDAPGTYMGVSVIAADFFDGTNYYDVTIEVKDGVAVKRKREKGNIIVETSVTNNIYNIDPAQIVPSEAFYSDETLAGDILKRVDKNTGENLNFREVTTWVNGSPMTDANIDNVIYIKKNNKYYKRQYSGVIKMKWFGIKADGVTDDTNAINLAMQFSARIGGGDFEFDTGQTVIVKGTILLPTNTRVNLNSCKLLGDMQTMWKTAYLNNGVLISNEGTANEAIEAQIRDSSVFNGMIINVQRGFYLKNFILGCNLHDLVFNSCVQSWFAYRCFYSEYTRITSLNGNSQPGVFAYHFSEENNAIKLTKVVGGKNENFLFEKGTTAISIDNCTAEGGTTAFKFKDSVFGAKINGCYFEAVKDVFDFSELTIGNLSITGNYMNTTDRVFVKPSNLVQMWGVFDETNAIVGVNYSLNGYVYRGLVQADSARNMMKFTFPGNIENLHDLPANWSVSENTTIESISSYPSDDVGNVVSKDKKIFGVIPIVRSGDSGSGYAGIVLGATSSQTGTADNFTLHFDTKIKWQVNTMFAKFVLLINTNSAFHNIFGSIFGANCDYTSDSGKTTVISEHNGFVRVSVSGFSESNLNYAARGSFQMS